MIGLPLATVIWPAVFFLTLEAVRDLARRRGYPAWPFLCAWLPAVVFGLIGVGVLYGGMFLVLGRRKRLRESWQCPECRFIQEPTTSVCSCGYDRSLAAEDGSGEVVAEGAARDTKRRVEDARTGIAAGLLGLLGWFVPTIGIAVSGFAVRLGTVTRRRGNARAATAAQVLGIVGFVVAVVVYVAAPGLMLRTP